MGIPTLFRHLFENYGCDILKTNVSNCDYLFFDFNSILYNVYSKNEQENQNSVHFIHNIYLELELLCQRLNPSTFIGIYLDGVAPRAKMIQQRSRRYKSILLQKYLSKENEIPITNHICPGTKFMQNLCTYLENKLPMIKEKLSHRPTILFSSVNVPGEGEHKIMHDIRKNINFRKNKDSIVVMSPDNDLISLLMLCSNKNVLLMRYMDMSFKSLLKSDDNKDNDLIFIFIDAIKEKFEKENQIKAKDMDNILLDYNFLLSICGNDFVMVLPFMKIKSGGIDKLLGIYNTYQSLHGEYLIHKNNLSINSNFFLHIMNELSRMEKYECKKWGRFINREQNHPDFRIDNDESLSTSKKKETKINHLYLCNSNHPLYDEYKDDFSKINFLFNDHEFKLFKAEYYDYFMSDSSNREKRRMVSEYLKSLKFTLLYYNNECPSESWYYPFRCAPLFSDIVYQWNSGMRFEHLSFSNHKQYHPFEQLMMILPKESSNILPGCFSNLFSKYKYNYPLTYKVDAIQGMKFIYSEVILPEWQYLPSLLRDMKSMENFLTEDEKKRNVLKTKNFKC